MQILNTEVWNELDSEATIFNQRTIEDALDCVRQLSQEKRGNVEALVTGSLHLVSGVLCTFEHFD